MGIRERHEEAYRRRAGLIGILSSCCCLWPIEVEPTTTGHAESCPSHIWLDRQRTHRYEAGVGWVALDGSVEPSTNPHACCSRDTNGDGSCDVHSAQGVLRSHATRAR